MNIFHRLKNLSTYLETMYLDVWMSFHRKRNTKQVRILIPRIRTSPTIIFTWHYSRYSKAEKLKITYSSFSFLADYTSSATKAIHIYMWPTGDIFILFYGKPILPFPLLFQSNLLAKSLINRKEERAGGKESSTESCGWWYPAGEKHTHLCFYIILQPLTWTGHLGLTRSRYHDSMRSRRRERGEWEGRSSTERERDRLSMFHIPSCGSALQWQCPLPLEFVMSVKHRKLATEYPSIHPLSSSYFPQPKTSFLEFCIDLLSFKRQSDMLLVLTCVVYKCKKPHPPPPCPPTAGRFFDLLNLFYFLIQ